MKESGWGWKMLDVMVGILLFVGGLNWGLIGFFEFNLFATLFGEASTWSRVLYALIGLSALWEAYNWTLGFKATQHRWCELPATVKH